MKLCSHLLLALSIISFSANADLVVVSNSTPNGWGFFEEVPNGTGILRESIAPPPLGTGSANMMVDATGRMLLGTLDYAGVRLDEIQFLEYNTWQEPTSAASANLAITLQFDMDYDLSDGNTNWQGRLVFEPVNTPAQGGVVKGAWQTWNPHLGNWWMSGSPIVGGITLPNPAPISAPVSFDTIIAMFPDAGLRQSIGILLFKAGGPWPGFDGDVDALTVTVNGVVTTFDYEVEPPIDDTDGDGILDDVDACIYSDLSTTIVIGGCDTGVTNVLLEDGCTLSDLVAIAAIESTRHGAFMKQVARMTNAWANEGLIAQNEKGKIRRCAAKSK